MAGSIVTGELTPGPDEQKAVERKAEEMFDTNLALRPEFINREPDLAHTLGLTIAQQAAEQEAFTDTIRETGLDGNTFGRRLYGHFVDSRIAEAHGRGDDETIVDEIQRNSEATRQQLAGTYGREVAEDLLARAEKFVAQFPALKTLMTRRGIGSRPDIVVPIVEHVRRINFK